MINIAISDSIRIRQAEAQDAGTVFNFIRALAHYERLEHEVVSTEEKLRETLFGDPKFAEVLLLEVQSKAVGFALFFHNYSTFLGRPGIYLEDLFVLPEMRGQGYGKMLLSALAQIAVERKCGRLEWSVLDWNEPAIRFYKSIGAKDLNEWTVYRLTGEELQALGSKAKSL